MLLRDHSSRELGQPNILLIHDLLPFSCFKIWLTASSCCNKLNDLQTCSIIATHYVMI